MPFVPWMQFWRDYYRGPNCPRDGSTCNLDDLAKSLAEYLKSANEVAAGAAKNVEDAKRLMIALEAIIERKKASQR